MVGCCCINLHFLMNTVQKQVWEQPFVFLKFQCSVGTALLIFRVLLNFEHTLLRGVLPLGLCCLTFCGKEVLLLGQSYRWLFSCLHLTRPEFDQSFQCS